MKGNNKFVEFDLARIYRCQLKAIEFATARLELVAVYKASRRVILSPMLLANIVMACREKQASFVDFNGLGGKKFD